jgi:hypothetical protein
MLQKEHPLIYLFASPASAAYSDIKQDKQQKVLFCNIIAVYTKISKFTWIYHNKFNIYLFSIRSFPLCNSAFTTIIGYL